MWQAFPISCHLKKKEMILFIASTSSFIQRTKNLKHMLLIASKREIFQFSDDENYHQITLIYAPFPTILIRSRSSQYCLLLLIFSLSTTLFHHQNSFIFFATKKCANFYVYENFFTNTMNFILERQLLVHSGLCEERSKKSSHSKKREQRKEIFLCWQTVCAKKRIERNHDLLTKRTVAISIDSLFHIVLLLWLSCGNWSITMSIEHPRKN